MRKAATCGGTRSVFKKSAAEVHVSKCKFSASSIEDPFSAMQNAFLVPDLQMVGLARAHNGQKNVY